MIGRPLLWLINLGCIDLNQWYARCDDVHRPDYLHFDLDPGEGTTFEQACECALIVREALTSLGMKPYVKTTGSRGLHVYVALARGPLQEVVHTFAKALATELTSAPSQVDDGWVPSRGATERARRRGLQAECVGADAGEHLLGATEAVGHGLDASDLEGSRKGYPPRGFQDRQRAPTHRKGGRSLETAAGEEGTHESRSLLQEMTPGVISGNP